MSSQITADCVLVAEIIGDTPLVDKIGHGEAVRAVVRCRNRAERSVDAYQGLVAQAEGRRLIARFAKGEQAVLAAFDMRTRAAQLPPASGVTLSIRIVLHRGRENESTEQATVAAACSMIASVGPGQIMVSGDLADELPDTITCHLDAHSHLPAGEMNPGKSLYQFRAGATPTREVAFAPHSTSIAIEPSAFDTTTHSQSPIFSRAASHLQRATLKLRFGSLSFPVSDVRPVLLAGREEGNDLVILDRRASRHHARIEWRQQRFVLIDTSTNGTYLIDDAGTEVVLRRGEADLPVRGRIGFGYSPQENGVETAFYDIEVR